jgi:sugar/nucleoside kinase (ribokinase family)
MDRKTACRILSAVPDGQVGILGDFCTDVYWEIHPERGERSIETGLLTTPVAAARYSPGGAGNIAANLRALGMKKICCFGAVGTDPFGQWLKRQLVSGPETDFLLEIGRQDYHTPVYCKPLLNGIEQSRLDLGNTPLDGTETDRLLRLVKRNLSRLKVLIINQQLKNGIHSDRFRREFAALLRQADGQTRFIYDGRDHLDAYPDTVLKINADAASSLAFGEPGHPVRESGLSILRKTGKELVITDGERGCCVFEPDRISTIPAIPYSGPTDTVGAGDSFTAGFAWALAGGASLKEAAGFGNACSAVTIRKINRTGVPSPDELLAILT